MRMTSSHGNRPPPVSRVRIKSATGFAFAISRRGSILPVGPCAKLQQRTCNRVTSYSSSKAPRGGNVRRRVPFYKRKWVGALVILFLMGGVALLAVGLWVIKPLQEQAEAFDLEILSKIERASIVYDR